MLLLKSRGGLKRVTAEYLTCDHQVCLTLAGSSHCFFQPRLLVIHFPLQGPFLSGGANQRLHAVRSAHHFLDASDPHPWDEVAMLYPPCGEASHTGFRLVVQPPNDTLATSRGHIRGRLRVVSRSGSGKNKFREIHLISGIL